MLTKERLAQIEHSDFRELLDFMKAEYGSYTAICYHDVVKNQWVNKTAWEFEDDILKCAALIQREYGMGMHLAISSANSYAYTCVFFGIVISGNVAVLLDATMKGEPLETALKLTDSTACFTEGAALSYGHAMFRSLQETFGKAMDTADQVGLTYEKNAERLAIIFSTSGVTSNPKYVMLSQKNMIFAALNGVYRLPLDSGFKTLSILPPNHVFEVCCGLLYPMISGGTIVQNDSPAKLKENLALHKPDFIVAVPTIISTLNMLFHMELTMKGHSCVSSLKYIIGGGANVQKEVIQDFYDHGIFVIQGYGLTETGASVAMNGVDNLTTDTVGKPMYFSKVRICDGEILVSSPDVMLGYYKNPAATEATFDGEWFKTGDIGSFDSEGNLIIHGRIKNVIVLPTGENVYPEEIEERLCRNRGVEYCKVYGDHNRVAVDLFSSMLTEQQLESIVEAFNMNAMKHQRISVVKVLREKPLTTALGKPLRR